MIDSLTDSEKVETAYEKVTQTAENPEMILT